VSVDEGSVLTTPNLDAQVDACCHRARYRTTDSPGDTWNASKGRTRSAAAVMAGSVGSSGSAEGDPEPSLDQQTPATPAETTRRAMPNRFIISSSDGLGRCDGRTATPGHAGPNVAVTPRGQETRNEDVTSLNPAGMLRPPLPAFRYAVGVPPNPTCG
jgi:hypothetical protein